MSEIEVCEDLDEVIPESNGVGVIHSMRSSPHVDSEVVGVGAEHGVRGGQDAACLEIRKRKGKEHHDQKNNERLEKSPNYIREH
jgi:hypothetical protein